MQPLPFRQQNPIAPAYRRGWVDEAVAAIEADQCRTADTHLIRLIVPALAGIDIYLKDESTHPTGSLKHRLARSLFLYALCNGHIREGTPVIEASSGSTAVSEAYFAQMIGVPFYAVMPRTTSAEKIAAIEHYGGNCHLIDDGRTLYAEAAALAARLNGHYMDQFTFAERATDWRGNNNIAESIFTQLKGEPRPIPDWIVMGAGTGGTSATIGRYLRYRQYPTRLCVVDVEHSAFFDCFRTQDRTQVCERPSLIEGVGRPRCEPSFVPGVVDRMMKIPDAATIAAMNVLSRRLRRAVGGSTGTNFLALCRLASEMRKTNVTGSLVTLICDSGERYRQTYYEPAWLNARGLDPAPVEAALSSFLATGDPLTLAVDDVANPQSARSPEAS
ncbi:MULTISPECIES: PLP-dependent cysteine synthase family protein [unclassified Bradyrhizobium]|uniref:PLP-dependent cysteine synthase family protein n=1 Tax=unclassified Bradyrhizobium TaxID=2631580 RepID=UPI002478B05B|nr:MULTISPECIES: PLP-dependent cysteine synthase family protein [unclassified Bradyrhizobium]WGR75345.1 PLP-dependent cysteine synthase family protein [Bradyrhizobium sp. ISRA426]WGR82850.1 PLP-dependent cysteine synthase family protein [Bradyrhizobium sp. ISRA430]WGR90546.1 PLP-dependent cysteine synthase family protein [Bradyrhizobium sp. ISRA432]